jgi:putative glutamine transport system substrate-binding protein
MKHLKAFFSSVCLAHAILISGAENTTANAVDKIKERGYLTVGIRTYDTMMSQIDPKTNQYSGFEPEIAREMAKEILKDRTKIKFVGATSQNRIADLIDDKVDLMIFAITITDDRKKQIDFSDPYYLSSQQILIKKGAFKSLEDLSDKKIAVIKGTLNEEFLHKRLPKATAIHVKAGDEAFEKLEKNHIDAMAFDESILFPLLAKGDNRNLYETIGGQITVEPYGIGMKKGQPELLKAVNKALEKIKASGKWKEIYDKTLKPFSGYSADPPA